MKPLTKYQAYDGSEFTDPNDCLAYEEKCRAADAVISQLPPRPKDDGCRFSNGHGYIQHDLATFRKVRRELLELALKEFEHKWFRQSLEDETVHPSWAARMIGECCNGQLDRAWLRIQCVDSQGREWGQPYYANNPDKAEQIQLNA